MLKMQKTFGGLASQQGKWEQIMQTAGRHRPVAPGHPSPNDLTETQDFGANPGALRMFSYIPPQLLPPQVLPPQVLPPHALLVVLHGCTQTAESYDRGAGWSTLAERFGFALLLPEQQRSNNPNGCFNWFQTGDIERGDGEALSIRNMVAKMVSDQAIDPAQVFVTGLSAGGAMASVMLATYPDVFAGGAIIAGLPYGAASNVQQALRNMYQCTPRPARDWGDLVRRASPHKGPWPLVSVWHGGSDSTVIPLNATEIVKQWTDVHGLTAKPSFQTVVDGYPRQVWVNQTGDELIESYTIPNMAHGTPLATGEADDQCGAAGPFLFEVGISSSYHIAKFFGLTRASSPVASASTKTPNVMVVLDKRHESGAGAARSRALEGEVLEPEFDRTQIHPRMPPSSRLNVAAVITKALRAAGLMKDT